MRIAVSIFAILFAALHALAAAAQFKSDGFAVRGSAVQMVCGSVMLVCAAVQHLTLVRPGVVDAMFAAAGCVLICLAAYLNGKQAGKLHPSHHVVRGAIAALLVAGFAI